MEEHMILHSSLQWLNQNINHIFNAQKCQAVILVVKMTAQRLWEYSGRTPNSSIFFSGFIGQVVQSKHISQHRASMAASPQA